MKTFLMISGFLLFTSCASSEGRFTRFIDGLNERSFKGCYANNVAFAGGFGAAASITASGYVVTGGMSVEDCIALRTNHIPGE